MEDLGSRTLAHVREIVNEGVCDDVCILDAFTMSRDV